MRVLVVEDEPKVAADIAAALTRAGYIPEISDDGEDAWFRGDTENYSAIVLDLGLPKLDGLSVLKRWRAAGLSVPIIILTARGSWTERVEGIDAGADDYLAKPFEVEELLARLRAIIRRSAGVATPLITVGNVEVDPRQMRISVDGRPVQLSPLEYRAVSYLIHSRGRVVSQQELSEHIYGGENYRENNTLEVLIGRLRRKIGVDLIETRRGYGYVVPNDQANGET